MKVRAKDGSLISGVVSAKPPHFMTAEEKTKMPALDEIGEAKKIGMQYKKQNG